MRQECWGCPQGRYIPCRVRFRSHFWKCQAAKAWCGGNRRTWIQAWRYRSHRSLLRCATSACSIPPNDNLARGRSERENAARGRLQCHRTWSVARWFVYDLVPSKSSDGLPDSRRNPHCRYDAPPVNHIATQDAVWRSSQPGRRHSTPQTRRSLLSRVFSSPHTCFKCITKSYFRKHASAIGECDEQGIPI